MKKLVRGINLFDLINIILPVAVCMLVLVSTAVAQTTAAPPATGQVPLPHVQFNVAPMPQPKRGVPYAYNLCTGQVIPYGDIWGNRTRPTPAKGLKYDTAHPCGPFSDSVNPMVSGGNPPYHFQLDSGGFPPIGMHLGLNGTLYGKPVGNPPLGGYQPFSVCAVDLNGNQDCQKVTYSEPPQTQAKAKGSHHGPPPLVLGAIGLGLVGVGVAAAGSSSSGSGSSSGMCDGTASSNACGACTSDSQCPGAGCWTGNPPAPFCP